MTDNDKTAFLTSNKKVTHNSVWTACIVVLKGTEVGNKVLLNKNEITIGRAKNADLCLTRGDVSRTHAVIQRINEQEFLLIDKDSMNGTLVNAQEIHRTVLKDQDVISIGDSELKFLASDNPEQSYYEGLYKRLSLDKVLRIHNKYYFLSKLDDELILSQQHDSHLSLVLFEVDDFKEINESYGHQAGDAALIHLAEICKNTINESDFLCRYSVEKFAIIMPNTSEQAAYALSLSLQTQINSSPITYADVTIDLTVSIGVTNYIPNSMTQSFTKGLLISQAEKAMYISKRNTDNNKVTLISSIT